MPSKQYNVILEMMITNNGLPEMQRNLLRIVRLHFT